MSSITTQLVLSFYIWNQIFVCFFHRVFKTDDWGLPQLCQTGECQFVMCWLCSSSESEK